MDGQHLPASLMADAEMENVVTDLGRHGSESTKEIGIVGIETTESLLARGVTMRIRAKHESGVSVRSANAWP